MKTKIILVLITVCTLLVEQLSAQLVWGANKITQNSSYILISNASMHSSLGVWENRTYSTHISINVKEKTIIKSVDGGIVSKHNIIDIITPEFGNWTEIVYLTHAAPTFGLQGAPKDQVYTYSVKIRNGELIVSFSPAWISETIYERIKSIENLRNN